MTEQHPMIGSAVAPGRSYSCACMGPQNGQPLCPCQMRGVEQRDGRWVRKPQDLGPVLPSLPPCAQHGCICPPGAEKTCQGAMCPRRPWKMEATA